MRTFVSLTMNEADRRLLIILMIILLILFLLIGAIGMLVRYLNDRFAKRMDTEIHDVVVYRVISNPKDLRRYGRIKNKRLFTKQSFPPLLIAFVSLLLWLIYSAISGAWGANHFSRFGTLFFRLDWGNEDNYVKFWGMTVLAKWPELAADAHGGKPYWDWSYWASYLLVPMWIGSGLYYLITVQAFICRHLMLRKRCRTVFSKSLENFNLSEAEQREFGNIQNPPR